MSESIISTTVLNSVIAGNGTYANAITVTNTGTVAPTIASYNGVQFSAPGYLLNQGSITGASGGFTGTSGAGVSAFNGPAIVNAASGTITGGSGSFGGFGVNLENGGSLSNAGSIAGGYGRYVAGKGVLVGGGPFGGYLLNTGTITGGAGGPEDIGGTGVEEFGGASINNAGIIIGGGAAFGGTGIYIEASLQNSGTIIGGFGNYGGFGAEITADGIVTNTNIIMGGNGTVAGGLGVLDDSTLFNSGIILGGNAENGVGGTGAYLGRSATLFDSGVIEGGNGAVSGAAVQFGRFFDFLKGNPPPSTDLVLEQGASIIGAITDFTIDDKIIVDGFSATSETFVTGAGLILSNATASQTLDMTGNFSNDAFVLTTDGTNSTVSEVVSIINTPVVNFVDPGNGIYANNLTITNSGTIAPIFPGSIAVDVAPTISNAYIQNNGLIRASAIRLRFQPGYVGVYLGGQAVFVNAGSIVGGFAVDFPGGIGVVLDSASVFTNTSTGSITGGYGYLFIGGAGVYVDGGTLLNAGTISGGAGTYGGAGVLLTKGEIINSGLIEGGTGTELNGAAVTFSGTGSTLIEETSGTLAGAITGFTTGDTIIAEGFAATSESYVTGTGLILTNASGGTETLDITSGFSAGSFIPVTDGTNTTITAYPAMVSNPAVITTIAYSGGIVLETIAATGLYDLTADGASGGYGPNGVGGAGAQVSGTFALNQGDVLEVLVGGQGQNSNDGGGGGGGTFIYDKTTGILLEAAGGGGGGETGNGGDNPNGQYGLTGTSGGPDNIGGSNGFGGVGGSGGGGGGFLGNGSGTGGSGGVSFRNGGAGGSGYNGGGHGGFGGGAGGLFAYDSGYGFYAYGGGGGGFSGGGGGAGGLAAGGGGSYINPAALNSSITSPVNYNNSGIVEVTGPAALIPPPLISIISTTVFNTVIPGNGTYANAITVTTTGTVTPASGSQYKDGVQFSAPGYLLNQGSITGASGGAYADSGYGVLAFNGPTIVNAASGTITGGSGPFGGYGVYLKKGASLSNAGSIAGGYGRYDAGTGVKVGSASYGGYLFNTGTITGGSGNYNGGYGVALSAGTIVNTGLITGGGGRYGGIGLYIANGISFTNAGSIAGGDGSVLGGTGVEAYHATFTNAASGVISGGNLSRWGLDQAGGTGANFGTITAGLTNGTGVFLHRGGSFTNAAGGVIIGGISTGPAGGNGIYIEGALSSAYNSSAYNAGTITGGAGGSTGGNGAFVYYYASLTNGIAGTISGGAGIYGGTGVFLNGATLTNSGLIAGGTGTLRNGAAIAFEGAGSTLIEAAAATLAGAITGFAPGDTIIAAGFAATSDHFVPGTGLVLTGNAGSETFGLTGNLATPEFALSSDGTNSTITFIPSIDAQFDYSGSIVTETIALTGLYDIEAQGAQGGSSDLYGEQSGGTGAILDATIALTAGNVIEILVAGAGDNGNGAGGGGGATFIYDETTGILLEAAGGGGGAGAGYTNVSGAGQNAGNVAAGNRGGGAVGATYFNGAGGGGGGGYSGNGFGNGSNDGGYSFVNGGAGGQGHYPGGFGGGGGAGAGAGGGGGGFSGGMGGHRNGNSGPGGGYAGTSYIYQGASYASFDANGSGNTGNGFAGIKLVAYGTAGPTPALISIISSTVFNTVNPGNGTYASAITVTSTGAITPAAGGPSNNGVQFATPGYLLNQGRITGAAPPAPGSGQYIIYGGYGVYQPFAGTVDNGGTITGGSGYYIGGIGVFLGTGSLTNSGTILGGAGGSGGGPAVYLNGPAIVTNTGVIQAASGAAGGTWPSGAAYQAETAAMASRAGQARSEAQRSKLFGMVSKTAFVPPVVASFVLDGLAALQSHAANGAGAGTKGGSAAGPAIAGSLGVSVSIANSGTITGGTGGTGGHDDYPFGIGSAGGNGSDGIALTGNAHITNSSTIAGGAGGAGGAAATSGQYGGVGGNGGNGATGVYLAGPLSSLTNTGLITGGQGGMGGTGLGGGGGGAGGDGVVFTSGTVDNQGTILGGALGAFGNSNYGVFITAYTGGAGVAQSGGTLVNAGRLTGGYGFNGGAGLYQTGGTARNSGRITGGAGGIIGGYGVYLKSGAVLSNTGTLTGGAGQLVGGYGAFIAGATLINQAGAQITGGAAPYYGSAGVYLTGAATLINDGTVTPGSGRYGAGPAIAFYGTGNELIEGASATLSGSITGFAAGDTIILDGFAASSEIYLPGTGIILTETGGITETLDVTSGFTAGKFTPVTDGTNTTLTANPAALAHVGPPVSIISSLYFNSVVPGSASYANNVTITNTGAVLASGPAVDFTGAGTVSNAGLLLVNPGAAGAAGTTPGVYNTIAVSNFDSTIENAVAANRGGEARGVFKRGVLAGMIKKTAFVQPVVASFALDTLDMSLRQAQAANGYGQPAGANGQSGQPGASAAAPAITGTLGAGGSIANTGTIAGGAGGDGGQGGVGGAGPAGNPFILGVGLEGGQGGNGGNGGNGSAGIALTGNATISNAGSIAGGAGGAGGNGGQGGMGGPGVVIEPVGQGAGGGPGGYSGNGGAGGNGADGVSLTGNASVTNSGIIAAGAGGAGGTGGAAAYGGPATSGAYQAGLPGFAGNGGNGGNGGTGAYLAGTMASLTNTGVIIGGAGGNGGAGYNPGQAGKAGDGLHFTGYPTGSSYLANVSVIDNQGTIIGGAAGSMGTTLGIQVSLTAAYVTGGAGVAQTGGTLLNDGAIIGGAGTYGGAGVLLTKGEIINAGLIEGGTGAALNGAAVAFSGTGSTLIEETTGTLAGAITGFTTGDTIIAEAFDATSESYVTGTGLILTNASGGTETLDIISGFSAGSFIPVTDGTNTTITAYPATFVAAPPLISIISSTVFNTVIPGNGTYASGVTITNSGTVFPSIAGAIGVSLGAASYVLNQGSITGGSGSYGGIGVVLDDATLTNAGTIAGGTGTTGEAAAISFTGTGNELIEAPTGTLDGAITGFAAGDLLVLQGFTTAAESYVSGVGLILTNSLGATATLDITGSYTSNNFIVTNDGGNSTITAAPLITFVPGVVLNEVTPGEHRYATTLTIGPHGTISAGSLAAIYENSGFLGVSILNEGLVKSSNTAIILNDGGTLTNVAGGRIIGGERGVLVGYEFGTVFNSGSITAKRGEGVYLSAGGYVYNATGALISGARGGIQLNGFGTLSNFGTILSTGSTSSTGVRLLDGMVSNLGTGAAIYGAEYGIRATGGAVIINQGRIGDGAKAGIRLAEGGYVGNLGTISGAGDGISIGHLPGTVDNQGTIAGSAYGILLGAGGTVINSGTISGGSGTQGSAIEFGVGGSRLIIDPGAAFHGAVSARGKNNILELAADSGTAAINLGTSFAGFQTISFDAGSSWSLQGDVSEFDGGEVITGFTAGDTIILANFEVNTLDTTYVPGIGLELTDTAGNHITLDIVEPAGVATGNFAVIDPPDTTTITYVTCFAAGTRILTADGRLVAVEALAAGDAVEVFDGSAREIIWIGHRRIDLTRHPRPETARPIRIAAGALAPNLPWRDLIVSPDHGLYFEGHLIPAKALLNGATIRQLDVPSVSYFHIELASHDILFAEGVAAETYLETGNRNAFENAEGAMILHPDFAQMQREAESCAIFAEAGPMVEAVRQRLLDRARIDTSADPQLEIIYAGGGAVIRSRSAIPGELTADPRDRRQLGVKIAGLKIGRRIIPLDHPLLAEGWHAAEPDGRWTDGAAVIPPALMGRAGKVTIQLAATLRYPQARSAKAA